MITVYTVAYNEDAFIQFMIDHYRSRFPGCEIVVHDNESTDATVEIAMDNGAEVRSFNTNNQFSDSKHLEIKNNCWKDGAKTDWVLICDSDELLDINQSQLLEEENLGISIIRSEGYNMINMEDNIDIKGIKYGARAPQYDKSYLFNKKFISEINYSPGCHSCNPIGNVKYSDKAYLAYHYNFINLELSIAKYKHYATRLSAENLQKGWGFHYLMKAEQIKDEFMDIRSKAIKLL
jgi:glycosyltransferase involved in cell wall biosynthesis